MAEYVKKTPFGYKEVQGGYSSPEWEYAILTRKEYNNQETELRVAKAGKSEAEEKARKNIDRANVEAKREINEAYKTADEQVEKTKKELAAANAEIEYQRGLNENLLRINRERTNADRKLKPKKEHTGYVVCSSSERDYTYRINRKNHKIVLWETVLQSPYTIDFTEELARKQITEELFEKDENGDFFITKIGITAGYPSGYAAMIENNEWAKEHKKYNVMLERKLRMNFRTGYWEMAFYHTKPLSCVPKDMRMC
ncbi:MAG: hypothetical protein IJA32_08520 [Lachnospiraceae bacterium]|nr:hypothetical protein [Lachnospiraceae bacterium]